MLPNISRREIYAAKKLGRAWTNEEFAVRLRLYGAAIAQESHKEYHNERWAARVVIARDGHTLSSNLNWCEPQVTSWLTYSDLSVIRETYRGTLSDLGRELTILKERWALYLYGGNT